MNGGQAAREDVAANSAAASQPLLVVSPDGRVQSRDSSNPSLILHYRRKSLVRFARLWRWQRGRCWYCWHGMLDPRCVGVPFGTRMPGKMATEDHRWPRHRGGRRNDRNIVLACRTCNGRKGGRSERQFLVQDHAYLELRRRAAPLFRG